MTPYVPMFNQPPIRTADASEEAPTAEPFAEKALNLNTRLIKHPAATFFLSAKGDALLEAGIRHGDLLIVDRSLEPAPSRVVIAVVEGEFTVQYFERLKKHPAPKNQLNGSKSRSDNSFEIWGVVTYVIHPL